MANTQPINNSSEHGTNLLFPTGQLSTQPNEEGRKSWISADKANLLRPQSRGIMRNCGDNSKIDQNIREGSPAGHRGNPIGPHKLNIKDHIRKDNVGISEIERSESEDVSQLSASRPSNFFLENNGNNKNAKVLA